MVNIPALSNYIAIAKGCKNEKCPHKVTNFKKKANPYKAKFGNDWKMHVKKAVALSPFVCITEMIAHIIQQSQEVMNGSQYEKTWYFYHDALSLMTSTAARKWMEEKKINNKTWLDK